jgi:hypothetical protein
VDTDDPIEARRSHKGAAGFDWVRPGMKVLGISGLYVHQNTGSIMIAPEQVPGHDYVGPRTAPDRTPYKD